MFSARSHKGFLHATEERLRFLERHSHIAQFGTLMVTLKNVAIKHLSEHYPLDQELSAPLAEETVGGLEIRMDVGGLVEQREFLQMELTNQLFLMVYINFEALFSRWCLRAFTDKGMSDPEQETINLMMGLGWEGKFSNVQQKLGIDLGRHKTKSWMKSKEWSVSSSGEQLDDPTRVLDLFRKKRNAIVHNDAQDGGGRVQANWSILLWMMPFLLDLSDLVERAFVKVFGWERQSVDFGAFQNG